MRLRIKDNLGMPVADAAVMVVDAPMPIHDIAAITDANGIVNLGDYQEPGRYTVSISHHGGSTQHSIDLRVPDDIVELAI
jgi:hypothetical protein